MKPFYVVICLFMSLALLAPAFGDERPPLELRRQIERHSVVIEVSSERFGTNDYGMGVIVARERDEDTFRADDHWIIVTAAHVVQNAIDNDDFRIRVRPHLHAVWIPATVRGAMTKQEHSPPGDTAYLSIPVKQTEFAEDVLIDTLSLAPLAAAVEEETVWAYGYDSFDHRLVWQSGTLRSIADDGSVEFAARGIRPGFSGGPLTLQIGPIGMVLAQGDRGQRNVAISYDLVASRGNELNGKFGLSRRSVLDAFHNAKTKGLAITLQQPDAKRWIMLEIDSVDGQSFSGRWYTYGWQRIRSFRNTNLGDWTASIAGDTVTLRLANPSLDRTIPIEPGTSPFELELVPTADLRVPGHALLRTAGDEPVYLAVPRKDCEMVAARLIRDALRVGGGELSFTGHQLESMTQDFTVRRGTRPHLAILLRSWEWHVSRVQEAALQFTVPSRMSQQTVTMVGRLIAEDANREHNQAVAEMWQNCPIDIRDNETKGLIARIDRDPSSPDEFEFEIVFELSDVTVDLLLQRVEPGHSQPGGFALQSLVIFYGER